jgi:hypothetical protein
MPPVRLVSGRSEAGGQEELQGGRDTDEFCSRQSSEG